ncbi:MAG: hypothetical protein PHD82_07695 [Candidatus Riflebacteria bacterium]|jgi:hypothetical protein|nr:hypothetical protein [Candidatus Riflebacteria bacterium]
MIDLKTWLAKNSGFRNYDDPDVDPDLVVSRHRKALAAARSAIRDHLEQQLDSVIKESYDRDHQAEKNLHR